MSGIPIIIFVLMCLMLPAILLVDPIARPILERRLGRVLRAHQDELARLEGECVLSALARLELDPWDEAARLAHLTREAAADQLARMIARLSDRSSSSSRRSQHPSWRSCVPGPVATSKASQPTWLHRCYGIYRRNRAAYQRWSISWDRVTGHPFPTSRYSKV